MTSVSTSLVDQQLGGWQEVPGVAPLQLVMKGTDAFLAAMHRAGLNYSGPIIADGKIHRINVEEDKERNSWYLLHHDPPSAGTFGCWKRGIKERWCDHSSPLSEAAWGQVRICWEEAESKHKREQEKLQANARKKAGEVYKRSKPAQDHLYLIEKQVRAHGDLRQHEDQLILPLRDVSGTLHSLQFIAPETGFPQNWNKKFLFGGRVKGCFFIVSDRPDGPLVICEGYATGASLHEATGFAVLCAMSCGNLQDVATSTRRNCPEREIVVAADNDAWTDGNPGVSEATKAARAIGAKLVVPTFKDHSMKPTDFNDLARLEGLEELRRQITFNALQAEQHNSTPQPFVAYYDCGHKDYWVPDLDGGWIKVSETSFKRVLRSRGLSTRTAEGANVSPVEKALIDVQRTSAVIYAGPLAGYPAGIVKLYGNRILVTSGPSLIKPQPGAFPRLTKLLDNLFLDPVKDQRDYVLGWLKVALESLRDSRIRRPGQALAIAGPRDCGKSLFQSLITKLLGGRAAKAYRYMSDRTEFNGELVGAEHLIIDDDIASRDIRARRSFGARLKEITVNPVLSCHAKYQQAISVQLFWRLTVTLNDDPEELMILPPMDRSLIDKIMLLRANKHEMPMPTYTNEEREEFWCTLVKELPAFAWHLEHWNIPEELRSERFGVMHYHHPDLLEVLTAMSPETELLNIIDAECFSQSPSLDWSGTAESLKTKLFNSASGHAAKRLLDWPNATGSYLGRLAKSQPSRVIPDRTSNTRAWLIRPPCMTA